MKKLRNRFIDDLKYPVTVTEDPYYEYLLSLCPGGLEDWKRLREGIEEEYDGNEEEFLKDYYDVRERMVQTLGSSEKWKEYCQSEIKIEKSSVRTSDIYNQEYADKERIFLSIDLTKANIQAFARIDPQLFGCVFSCPYSANYLWTNFLRGHIPIEKKTLFWYVLKSKYIRQVIFGNCNPKRQIILEREMIWEQAKIVMQEYPGSTLVMYGSDEVILELPSIPDHYPSKAQEVDTKICVFKLKSIAFETGSGVTLRIYKREFIGREGCDYKCIPRHYYAQITNLLEGNQPDPEDRDLVFYNEKELARFIERIKIKRED